MAQVRHASASWIAATVAPPAHAALAALVLALVTAIPAGTAVSPRVLPPGAGTAGAPGTEPDGGPVQPGWVDEAVRSHDVSCVVSVETRGAGSGVIAEHLACSMSMSDARVGGDLAADVTVVFDPPGSSAGAWTGHFTLTNGGGDWSGTGHGAAVAGAGGGTAPSLYGEVGYAGGGAYAGLGYIQLFAGEPTPSVVTGYVSGPWPLNPATRRVALAP